MSGLILLSIALIALVGALCTLLYVQQSETLRQVRLQQQTLANLDTAFKELGDRQQTMHKRIDQLATDVLQREIYQSADDRHQLAIQSARQGRSLFELTQRHGLSTDEAALIISLHSPQIMAGDKLVKNANLTDPSPSSSMADVI